MGQLDPRRGLQVTTANGPTRIPIQYHGFAWQPEDFNHWSPVGDYDDEHLARKHQRTGWGVPLVIVRQRDADERFMTRSLPFSATALLRPATNARPGADPPSAPQVLEVFNPLAVKTLPKDDGQSTPLAADLSAPLAWLNQNAPHLDYQAFLHPDRMHTTGQLVMLEPYQAGKIPVIFVHGLLSDPLTWNGLINELRASDWFNELFFRPLPFVQRAVFIGTPHGGSPIARERIGRLASHLQTHPDTVQEVLRILMLHSRLPAGFQTDIDAVQEQAAVAGQLGDIRCGTEVKLIRGQGNAFDPDQVVAGSHTPDVGQLVDGR
jgi:hypothetical protein